MPFEKTCPNCGKLFTARKRSVKYCSRQCTWANNGKVSTGEPCWWKNKDGYIEGRVTRNGERIQILQHRYFVENRLGRLLTDAEEVHHKNGIRDDNRDENLEVLLKGHHVSSHNKKRVYRSGYKANVSDDERAARSCRAKQMDLSALGREALRQKRDKLV